MAKYHVDIIINHSIIAITELFDYEKYKLNNQIICYEEQKYQISGGVNNTYGDGYANLHETNFEYLFSMEGMYSKYILDKLWLMKSSSVCYTVLYTGKIGFSFLDEMFDYMNKKFAKAEMYILEDQTDTLYQFSDFYKKHLVSNFFWLPFDIQLANLIRDRSR